MYSLAYREFTDVTKGVHAGSEFIKPLRANYLCKIRCGKRSAQILGISSDPIEIINVCQTGGGDH
ncbi:MAG: hypothetical protein BGO69_17830 [Bacteroidetes bacterium 46-16]|nr:MAG: hypothetical protein BGO69_17830 [Bacteroidetes bacterium 46-16]